MRRELCFSGVGFLVVLVGDEKNREKRDVAFFQYTKCSVPRDNASKIFWLICML